MFIVLYCNIMYQVPINIINKMILIFKRGYTHGKLDKVF